MVAVPHLCKHLQEGHGNVMKISWQCKWNIMWRIGRYNGHISWEHLYMGMVEAIWVNMGEQVNADQISIRVDTSYLQVELDSVVKQLITWGGLLSPSCRFSLHGKSQPFTFLATYPRIWVNYNISLTWILRPFGDHFPIHSPWFQVSVAVRSLLFTQKNVFLFSPHPALRLP